MKQVERLLVCFFLHKSNNISAVAYIISFKDWEIVGNFILVLFGIDFQFMNGIEISAILDSLLTENRGGCMGICLGICRNTNHLLLIVHLFHCILCHNYVCCFS